MERVEGKNKKVGSRDRRRRGRRTGEKYVTDEKTKKKKKLEQTLSPVNQKEAKQNACKQAIMSAKLEQPREQ